MELHIQREGACMMLSFVVGVALVPPGMMQSARQECDLGQDFEFPGTFQERDFQIDFCITVIVRRVATGGARMSRTTGTYKLLQ
jgi:hypothetical protein